MKTFSKLIALILCISTASAQVVFRKPILRPSVRVKYDAFSLQDIPSFTLGPLDNNALLAAAISSSTESPAQSDLHSGPFVFGKAFPVELSLGDGKWEISSDPEVKIWRLLIESPNAQSLNLVFSEFDIPENSEFYLRSAAFGELRGPFTRQNVRDDKSFAIAPLKGDSLMLEYYAPLSSVDPKISVSKIIHGFRSFETYDKSGECNINVACPAGEEWKPEIRSVAMILRDDGTGFCSGAMINNGKRDGRQLYLTAFHCVGRSDVTNNILMFNYEAQHCEGTDRSAPRAMTAYGMKKVAQWKQSDFALLELLEPIPEEYNVHLSGWSAVEEENPLLPVGIHHPSADIKKISFSHLNATEACWGWCDETDPLDHWKVQRWHLGTTEPGSSGSPLFDSQTHRIVGQLHGGSASCSHLTGYDVYGKLSYSFDKADSKEGYMKDALDPLAEGLRFMDGVDLNTLRSGKSTTPRLILQQ